MAENKWLFALTIFLSLIFFNLSIIVITSFFSFIETVSYIFIIIFSLIFGVVLGIILNKVTDSSRKLIIGGLSVSTISATIIFFLTSVLKLVNEQFQRLTEFQPGIGSVFEFFGNPGNPLILAILVFVFFNIPFVINNFRDDASTGKNMFWYLYGLLILIALIFFSDFILTQLYNYPYVPSS